jgi:hypothetical protein
MGYSAARQCRPMSSRGTPSPPRKRGSGYLLRSARIQSIGNTITKNIFYNHRGNSEFSENLPELPLRRMTDFGGSGHSRQPLERRGRHRATPLRVANIPAKAKIRRGEEAAVFLPGDAVCRGAAVAGRMPGVIACRYGRKRAPCGLWRTCTVHSRCHNGVAHRNPRPARIQFLPDRPPGVRCQHPPQHLRAHRWLHPQQRPPACRPRHSSPRYRWQPGWALRRQRFRGRSAGIPYHRREIGRSSSRYQATPSCWGRSAS